MSIAPSRCQKCEQKRKRHSKKSKRCSHTGTRTRVCWVRASYPNRLDYMGRLDETCANQPTTLPTIPRHTCISHTSTTLYMPRTGIFAPSTIASSHLSRFSTFDQTQACYNWWWTVKWSCDLVKVCKQRVSRIKMTSTLSQCHRCL